MFKPCPADPDVCLRAAVKAEGTRYYEYILVYVDDILALSTYPKTILVHLEQHYMLKPGSIAPPELYLGSSINRFKLPDNPTKTRWAMGSKNYVKDAVKNIDTWLDQFYSKLKMKSPGVLPSGYRPE